LQGELGANVVVSYNGGELAVRGAHHHKDDAAVGVDVVGDGIPYGGEVHLREHGASQIALALQILLFDLGDLCAGAQRDGVVAQNGPPVC
jgi:hypothetical protein